MDIFTVFFSPGPPTWYIDGKSEGTLWVGGGVRENKATDQCIVYVMIYHIVLVFSIISI